MTSERPVRPDFAHRSVEPVLAALNDEVGGYSVVRKFPGGVWGAWLVRDARGSHAVLKCVWGADWRSRLESAGHVVEALAARGAPVPRYLQSGYEADLGTWYVHEYLPGDRVEVLTPAFLDAVFDLNDLQARLATDLPKTFDWSAHVARRLDDVPALDAFARAAAVAREIEELVAPYRGQPLPDRDVVHGDFLVTQLLSDGARVTGVLDWDAAGRGDRGQDLALLFYNVFAQADRLGEPPSEVVLRVLGRRAVDVCGAGAFGVYLAYEALEALRFVSERNPKHVPWRTRLATRALDAYRAVVA